MAKSIIGFHYSIGGNKSGIGAFMDKLNQNGIPFLMKGADDAGLCFEGQTKGAAHGVENHLIYRVSTSGQNNGVTYDVPDYAKSPKDAAQEHFNKTAPKWPQELQKTAVWMEPINEPRAKKTADDIQFNNMHPTDWLGFFMLEYAKIANAAGFKVTGPSFNAGEPEVFGTNDYELPGMLAYLKYCAENPKKASLALHEYTWDRWSKGENWPQWYPILWGRVEAAMAAADKHNIPRTFSIFMTEWGFAHTKAPHWPECEKHMTAYNEWAANWPQVKGVAAWTLQAGWGGVDNDVQTWFSPLADYAVSRNFDAGVQPARTHTNFGGTLPGDTTTPTDPQDNGTGTTTGTGNTGPTPGPFRFTHWPTEHHSVIQVYNNNPEFYGQWQLTGHEGVDIVAPLDSRIFAAAPGTVTTIRAESEGLAYGNAVYITHSNGYRTAYAHLKSVNVSLGQTVAGGDLIGIADSTGNVIPKPTPDKPWLGAHLHLTLYHDGATLSGETKQPRDIIDPTPFLNAVKAPGWTPPVEPLTAGFAFAQSVQVQADLGKVINPGGVNLRAQPNMSATVKGLVPVDTIVRVTGGVTNDYLPVQVSASLFGDTTPTPGGTFERGFISFTSSANLDQTQPGTQFQATWVLQNTGTAVWPGSFPIEYLGTPIPENANTPLSSLGAATGHTLQSLSGQSQVNPGERVSLTFQFTAPTTAGTWASHWQLRTDTGQAIGNPVWIRVVVKGTPVVITPTPTSSGPFQPGMNINPDAHGLDIERMRGQHWVRWVYKAAAKDRNVDQAFNNQYRQMIQSYADAGMKSLIIINQETVWANAPWHNGDWSGYAGSLAKEAGRIAELCASFGGDVAYQIWNEEDSPPTNPSAIGILADNFATILAPTAAAIRAKHPGATIVIGGLNSGPDKAIAYAKQVKSRLGGSLPVDALAIHPYGRFVHNDPFYNQQFGRLQDALALWKSNFPDMPLWITEIGVADNNPIGPEHYEKIANYMREFYKEVADNHSGHVPVLLWFAWSDLMRNAGITTVGGQMKAHIGDAFKEMVERGKQAAKPKSTPLAFAEAASMADSEFLRFETTLADYTAVPAGSTFTNRWTYRNSGLTTWGDGYSLVYAPNAANSAPMMAKTHFDLSEVMVPTTVERGQEGTIALNMTAPEQSGRHYRSRWELRDPDGNSFGYLYAEITVVPAPTAGTGVQTADMVFLADQTVPDDSRFAAGTSFNKQWKVRNSGVRHWSSGFRLVYVEGDLAMAGGIASHMVPDTARDETVILTVPMVAPAAQNGQPTTFSSLWRMQDDRGNFFGEPIWVRIISLPTEAGLALGPYSDPSGWYSQLDPRWKNDRLGHGQPTIGSWGCLMTCYAMMLTAYGRRYNPAELNNRLKQIGDDGFRGPVVQFMAPTLLLPGLTRHGNLRSNRSPVLDWTEWTGEDPIARIDSAIAAGHTVIAQVDRAPNDGHYHADTESHWVILVSRTADGSDYLMLDPMTPANQVTDQPRSLMAKYGRRVPSRSNEENLRNAIQSALVYRYNGAFGAG